MDEGGHRGISRTWCGRRSRLLIVPVGISLFAVGFVVTMAAVSGVGAAGDGTGGPEQGALLFGGIAVSLAGVVAATAGPASLFLSKKRRDM